MGRVSEGEGGDMNYKHMKEGEHFYILVLSLILSLVSLLGIVASMTRQLL